LAGGPVKPRNDAGHKIPRCAPFIAFFAMSGRVASENWVTLPTYGPAGTPLVINGSGESGE
jgi:hypothetical protein